MAKAKKRILWVSRHPPLLKQLRELERIYGPFELVQYAGMVRDAKEVLELVRRYKADDAVLILPLSFLYYLVNDYGFHPVWPEMRRVPDDSPDFDLQDFGSGRKYKFTGFYRITGFEIRKEPL
jgi:hypothetical protein